uniref:Uncharacterized protein LOC100181521 n=1 Tax=Phallusia mammillata TaxID=59560 RepID=A0A6F9DI77_9ASCI|nr:uncharacterized protein LOC100181521 [Phallusia mammillata]
MKVSTSNKSVKAELNESLSNVVKNLQQESSQKLNGNEHIQSESINAQQFIAVLEAAFIHGLKATYYEKKKHAKDLPKPQFWNLVSKISHKDTLSQAKNLKMIKTHIGLCRAWLRLALNDSALSSYLTSLLSTAEHKSILSRYYETFALFRDSEQADIFLRYLQGAENLEFQLACNSSVLNQWVRSPLEMAGIINPSLTRKPVQENNNFDHSSSSSHLPRPPSFHSHAGLNDSLVSSSSGSSRHDSLRTPLSVSPAISVTSERENFGTTIPPSIVSASVGTSAAIQAEGLVEVEPHIGTAPSTSPIQTDGPRERGSVLHSRHLMKRRRRIRRNQSLDFGSSGSTWGSLSSLSSNMSTQSSPQKELNNGKDSRSSSTSSNAALTSNSSDMSGQDQTEDTDTQKENTPINQIMSSSAPLSHIPAWRRHSTPVLGQKHKHLSRHHRHKVHRDITPDELKKGVSEIEVKRDNDGDESYQSPGAEVESTSSTLNPSQSEQNVDIASETELRTVPSPTQFVLDVETTVPYDPMSPSRRLFQPDYSPIEEGPDIYARAPSPSVATIDESEEYPDSYFNVPCTPISPGNSLLCGVGWSSEHPYPGRHSKDDDTTSPITSPPVSSTDASSVQTDGKLKLAIHREGYLQKKGETLLFWRTRWFVLNAETLTYYKDKNMEERLGKILLSHVTAIKDNEVKKNKSISLLMQDGVQHQIAAESLKLILDWAKDLKKVIEIASKEGEEYKPARHNTIGSDFEVIENSGTSDRFLGDDVSGSWHGSMMHHMTRIANEQGLDTQNYQCADCASPIGIIYGAPRLCTFTGQYYCPQCHLNEEHAIPARMLHNWDFRKHRVSKRSKRFLSQIWRDPCIEMDKANPAAYKFLAQMKQLLPLRQKLSSLQPYLLTCRKLTHTQRNSKLQGNSYMMDNPHIYSAYDLQRAQSSDLCDIIEKIVSFGVDHVRSCPLCSAKGFLCEICKKDEVIFAFDTDTTTQCEECKGVYHRECLVDPDLCPKCERRNARFRKQEEELMEDVSDDEDDRSM